MQDYIRINQNDNVAVALTELKPSEVVKLDNHKVQLIDRIPAGHKFSISPIQKDEVIIKYGNPIGYATTEIETGTWIHTHNLKTTLGDVLEYSYEPHLNKMTNTEKSYFKGYRRSNGKVGVRNEIWIIPTVGCVNSIATEMAKQGNTKTFGSVEGVVAFPHPYGCSQMGDDQENTRRILADLVNHPNAGGVLVLGLGCENSNIDVLKQYIGNYDENCVRFLQCQDVDDEMEAGLNIIEELINYASKFQREIISAEELVIGLKCGGSDGLSGITANPLVGAFSDILISNGGSTILTEVPEMFGAEKLLMNRCLNEDLFHKTVSMINDFKNYYIANNQIIYDNPSPGNKKGGISSLEDKSLGCIQKSGNARIVDVLAYGDTVQTKGLNLLSAPGNDLVSTTALAAAGAQIVLFTTGRGTPFASPVPTIKISSNTNLSLRKNNWIDFNAGTIVEDIPLDNMSNALFQYVLGVASGKQVKAEEAGFHDMAIFKQGVTL